MRRLSNADCHTLKIAFTLLMFGLAFGIGIHDQSPRESFQTVLPTGKGPHYIGVADLNHDGKLDIVICNSDDGTLSVYLQDSRGDFQLAPGAPMAAGPQPNDIGFGDFNSDGNVDLAVPNHQSPYITIFLGNGDGTFRPAPNSPFRTDSYPHPHGVALGDFNGDRKLDVMTDSWGHDKIELFLGDGQGNLQLPGMTFPVGKRPYQRLRAADFNKDGHMDIVTTNLDDNTASILLGDGRGGFHAAAGSPVPAGAAPWSVAISDFNRDGDLDFVTVPYAPDVKDPSRIAVTVRLGDGKGGFAPAPGTPLPLAGCEGPNQVVAGDVNGDGYADVVVSCAQNDRIFKFFGSKNGFSAPKTIAINTGWGGLAAADLNGDGSAEIVVGNSDHNTITILWRR
jgi:hypothetical protein